MIMDNTNKLPFGMAPFRDRRAFILTAMKAALATTMIGLPGIAMPAPLPDLSVQQVMDIILREIPGAPFKETVDTLKSGNAGNRVTGIVTTMFATVKVINEAVRLQANFIIAHEPTFYNHTDNTSWVENNTIVAKKMELLARHNITVWRFHDYWHTHQPDGIFFGVIKKAGWEAYFTHGEPTIVIPADTLKNIALHLKARLGIRHLRVIGDLSKTCKKISLLPGASGGQAQMHIAESELPDLLIVGELHEWETAEYIRDARAFGRDISLIILGHSVSEEPGMAWLVKWLQPKVPGIQVTHVASNDPFTWI
jgi:putative NIF3 family GTP cyclohydrolase 1 type 2